MVSLDESIDQGKRGAMVSGFLSYAHANEEWKKRVLVHLDALRREGLISVWHDGMSHPGDHHDATIESSLATAELVLLLISADFIASEYCAEKEKQRALKGRKLANAK